MVIKGLNKVKLELSTEEAIELISILSAGVLHANKHKFDVRFWQNGFLREIEDEVHQPASLAIEIIKED